MCLPFVALLIAAAVDALPRRPLIVIAMAVLVALAIPPAIEQRTPRAKEHTDWSAVAALISDQRAADGPDATTAIVFDTVERHPRATARVIAYAYPDAFNGIVDVTLDVSAADSGRLWETTVPLTERLSRLQGADSVYLLTSPGDDGTMATAAALAPLGWTIADSWTISEVEIIRFTR
jgi:mannosyltransferase